MKYVTKENYVGGIILFIIVVLLTWFFVQPLKYNSQDKDCFDTGQGLICE